MQMERIQDNEQFIFLLLRSNKVVQYNCKYDRKMRHISLKMVKKNYYPKTKSCLVKQTAITVILHMSKFFSGNFTMTDNVEREREKKIREKSSQNRFLHTYIFRDKHIARQTFKAI